MRGFIRYLANVQFLMKPVRLQIIKANQSLHIFVKIFFTRKCATFEKKIPSEPVAL